MIYFMGVANQQTGFVWGAPPQVVTKHHMIDPLL